MKLYLALSCLQGRSQTKAYEELVQLNPYGIQLTPGNFPDGLVPQVPTRTHHGFSFTQRKTPVWDKDRLLIDQDSIHPPQEKFCSEFFWETLDRNVCLETMYPGYIFLRDQIDLAMYMATGRPLAVDISHMEIQLNAGVLSPWIANRVFNYRHIKEIHISQSKGQVDAHLPLTENSYGFQWAKEYAAKNDVPLVLECYMHRLSLDERKRQVDLCLS